MNNQDAQKVMRAFTPLSCQEMHERFSSFLLGTEDREQEEWIQEHLLVCDECSLDLTSLVEQKVNSGEVPLRDWPSELQLPSLEAFASSFVSERKGGRKGKEEAMQLQNFDRSALDAMSQIAWGADIRPENIKNRLTNVGIILAIGLFGTVATLLAIGFGLPKSDPSRLLAVFLLVGSIALTFVSSLAFALISWSAFVYQFVRSERMREDARTLLDAAVALGSDPEFDQEVVSLVVSELRNMSPEGTGLTSTDTEDTEQGSRSDDALAVSSTRIGEKLSRLIYDHLIRKKEVSHLIEGENFQHAA